VLLRAIRHCFRKQHRAAPRVPERYAASVARLQRDLSEIKPDTAKTAK
jgi:hypothetical protein